MITARRIRVFACCLWLVGCSSEHAAAPPPPAPPPPPLPVPSAPAPSVAVPAQELPAAPEPAPEPRAAEPAKAKPGKRGAKSSASAPQTTPAPKPSAPAPAPTPRPTPAAPAPAASNPKPAGKVRVPSTAHVNIDVPAAMQADLDRDPRMQPWINTVMSVIDRCYTQSAGGGGLAGTIEVVVTMHENERPDADIKSLPPQLSPIVACATGGLMRTKMPLFTGAEGARRNVRIAFK